MKPFKNKPTHIIIHHAQFRGKANVQIIREWHLLRDFDDIGYHFVITGSWFDDTCQVETGRDERLIGAHTLGYNSKSIGICLTGDGDHLEFTEEQIRKLSQLVVRLMIKYDIPVKNVLGHRETFLRRINRKTCPGKLISMDEIRKHITNEWKSQYHLFP